MFSNANKLNNIPAEMRELPNFIPDPKMDAKVKLLRSLFDYDKKSGKIYFKPRVTKGPSWCTNAWNTRYVGKEAGYNHDGYIRISLPDRSEIYAHQIIFAIIKGFIPKEIDHKDLIKSNNKWKNLREASHSQNAANCRKRKTNKSGYKGVSWSKARGLWFMQITRNNKRFYSYHISKEAAYQEYCRMSKKLHKEFSNVQ